MLDSVTGCGRIALNIWKIGLVLSKRMAPRSQISGLRGPERTAPNGKWLNAAVNSTLSSRFALIRGHPGTGKTFLAVRLTASVLADGNAPALYISDAGSGGTQRRVETMNVLPMERVRRRDVDTPENIPSACEPLSLTLLDLDFRNLDQFVEGIIRLSRSSAILRTYGSITIDCGSLSGKTILELVREWFRDRNQISVPRLLVTQEISSSPQPENDLLESLTDCVLNVGILRYENQYSNRTVEIIKGRHSQNLRGAHPFRIQDLFGLLHLSNASPLIVEVVSALNAEVIAYLKKHPSDLYRMHPRRFEELIAEILASFGWHVSLTAATRDGGYDIFAISCDRHAPHDCSWLVECKRWSPERKVGIDVVRGLYGVRELNSAFRESNVMIATTSDFSSDVLQCGASRYDLDLHNYSSILRWIDDWRVVDAGPSETICSPPDSTRSSCCA